jgi:hypothetical protein
VDVRKISTIIAIVLAVFGAGWKSYGHFAKSDELAETNQNVKCITIILSLEAKEDRLYKMKGDGEAGTREYKKLEGQIKRLEDKLRDCEEVG